MERCKSAAPIQPGNNSELPGDPKTPVSRLEAVRGCNIKHNLGNDRQFAIGEFGLPKKSGTKPERLPLEIAETSATASVARQLSVVVTSESGGKSFK